MTEDHVTAIVADASSLALDAAINGAFEGDLAAVEKTAERVFSEGGDYNALLGAALRHATALHRARLDAERAAVAPALADGAAPRSNGICAAGLGAACAHDHRAQSGDRQGAGAIPLADQIAMRALWAVAHQAKRKAG